MKKPTALLLAASLLAGAPGLPAYEASAAVFRSSPAGSSMQGRGWAGAVIGMANALQVQPGTGGASPKLTGLLGHLRLELSVTPRSSAALDFVSHLPAALIDDPEAFAALPLPERLSLLESAAAISSGRLESIARGLLEKDALTPAETAQLARMGSRWFYLTPETASRVKLRSGEKSVSLGRKIAEKLHLTKKAEDKAVDSELSAVFVGALTLAEKSEPSEALVASRLLPYVARALDEAETRVQARGIEAGKIHSAVIAKHDAVFGSIRPYALFKKLREGGLWTEFVAAMSLHSAEKLGQLGKEEGRNAMANAAEGDALRLPVPTWHPLFGKFKSISEWIIAAHGQTDDEPFLKGKHFYTAFGIPVRLQRGLLAASMAYAWMFKDFVAQAGYNETTTMNYLAAFAASILLYVAVLAHEYGHAFAAKLFGIRTRQLILNPLGGGADVLRGFRQAWPEFVIALAGPVVSVLVGGLFLGAAMLVSNPFFHAVLIISGGINIALAAFNMLPVLPMDGGRVLRAALTRFMSSYTATKITAYFSMAVAAAVAVLGLKTFPESMTNGFWYLATGLFFLVIAKIMSVHPGTVTVDQIPVEKK
jgi:Zn-dependent protease